MKNVLFLCTGNSCRSQMAEGLGKDMLADKFNFFSAGTQKHALNQRAVKVMKELGIDISHHVPKTIEELSETKIDYVVTVCSDAHENCPYFPAEKTIHIGFEDPPRLTQDMTDEEKILEVYRRVRDQIKEMILGLEGVL